jgi:hypothetical protein
MRCRRRATSRAARWVPLVSTLVLAGCGGGGDAARTSHDAPAVAADEVASRGQTAEPTSTDVLYPSRLVGMWRVTGPGVEPGSVLRIDPERLAVYAKCGGVYGNWGARTSGEFATHIVIADHGCDRRAVWAPNWLAAAAGFGVEGDVRSLLSAGGRVLVTLRQDGRVKPRKNRIRSLTEPPVVTPAQLAKLDSLPESLPEGLTPSTRAHLVGRWVPERASEDSKGRYFVRFDRDGTFSGSNGCNFVDGRWASASAGHFLAVVGASTDVGCDIIPVDSWLPKASYAALDGDVLVLVDRQGTELGRLLPG